MGGAVISFIYDIFQALIDATAGIFAVGSMVLLVVCIVRSVLETDKDKGTASKTQKR
jgi:hypothetical protein